MTETTTQTVLLAGATGWLGSRIAVHLLDQPDVRLRLLLRPGTLDDAQKKASLNSVLARGAITVEADLGSAEALRGATEGIDVVVSALQGGPDVIIDGQVALARAAADNGARRFLPSDFALDIFKATPGEHALFDLRVAAAQAVAETGLEHVHVLNGAFTEGMLGGFGVLDHDGRTATYWGTGSEAFDATTVDDTARYAARAATDRTLASGKLAVAAEQMTLGQVVDAAERSSGQTYDRRSLGSVEDLRESIARRRREGESAMDVVRDVYLLYMLSGQTALDDLQNDRYPDVRPQTLAEITPRT